MDLSELNATPEEKVEEQKVEEEVEDNSDLEQDLTDALSLLEDCNSILESLLTFKNSRKISTYAFEEINRLAQESSVFLAQYDGTDNDSTDWDDNFKGVG